MTSLTKSRIESIDLLKGLVMVIMALDHTRDYLHAAAYIYSPEDPTQTTLPIALSRWITHFCAPSFSFLAGISAFIIGRKKSPGELSGFLVKRGLWLIIIEFTILQFAWYFDIQFRTTSFVVIWALGVSMIVLAALIHLPRQIILIFSCLLIFGHNLFDNIHYPGSILWAIIHDTGFFEYPGGYHLGVSYPLIPWIAVMSLGYYFGSFYEKNFDGSRRKVIFNRIGIIAILAFVALRFLNLYGDPIEWKHFDSPTRELISFFNLQKYPPSLLFLLMTLGGTFVFLANSENLKGRLVNFFSTFGRVPFFYYILHLYLIHVIALCFAEASGYGWEKMILPDWMSYVPALKGFGIPLYVVYIVWMAVIALLYPVCKKFDNYKMNHKEKWWLSYF